MQRIVNGKGVPENGCAQRAMAQRSWTTCGLVVCVLLVFVGVVIENPVGMVLGIAAGGSLLAAAAYAWLELPVGQQYKDSVATPASQLQAVHQHIARCGVDKHAAVLWRDARLAVLQDLGSSAIDREDRSRVGQLVRIGDEAIAAREHTTAMLAVDALQAVLASAPSQGGRAPDPMCR